METFNLQPLARAITRLDEGWQRSLREQDDEQIRDGLIQRFEFTYEVSHKTLKRYLEYTSANPTQFDAMTFQDLIRTANEQGLLAGNWNDWKQYREMRSRTSRTYDEATARAVVNGIEKFLSEVQFLQQRLQEHLQP